MTGRTGLPLFDLPPLSRNSDPTTSYVAAERIHKTGKVKGQRQRIYEALKRHGGVTAAELADLMGEDITMPGRRLPELERAGFIRKGPARKCKIKSTTCHTWWIVDDQG